MLTLEEIRARYGGLPNLTDEQVVQRAYEALKPYYPDFNSFASEVGYDPNWNFGRGVRMGLRNTAAAGLGAASAGASALGFEGARDYLAEAAQGQQQQAFRMSRSVDDVDNFAQNPGAFLSSAAGQAVGYAVPSVAAGGVGGLAARGVAGAVGASANAARAATLGGVVGGSYASNLAQATGGIYNDLLQQGYDDPGRALAYGIPTAALDTAPELLGVGRLMKGSVGGLRGVGRAAAIQAPVEAGTEVGQTAIERVAAYRDLNSPDAWNEYRNAAALGAVGGGMFGAATGWRAQPQAPTVDEPGGNDLLQGRPDFQLGYSTPGVGPDLPAAPGAAPVTEFDPRQVQMFDAQGQPTYNADPSFGFGFGAEGGTNPQRDPTFAPAGGELSQPGFQMETFAPEGQRELFSYDQLPPGGPESAGPLSAAPSTEGAGPAVDTATGDLFANRPTATVQTDFSPTGIGRELRVAHDNKADGWLLKFGNGLSRVITDPVKTAEYLENAQLDNENSKASQATTARRDKAIAAAREIASRYQQRMTDAQAQEGVMRAQPGARVGQAPVSTGTEQQMRERNAAAQLDEQLADTDARVMSSRRRGMLDSVLNDEGTRNPLGRFTAMLKKNGLPAVPTAEEQGRIRRYLDAKAGLTGQGQGELRLEGDQLGGRTLPVAEPNPAPVEKAGRRQPKSQLPLDFEGKATQQVRRKQGVKNGEEVQQGQVAQEEVAPVSPEAREAKKRKYEALLNCLTR
jgi:hypothetical protein